MTIIVKENYGGRLTNEARIVPGEYDENDERLFGIADHLVDLGIAERTDSPSPSKKERPSKAEEVPAADQGEANAQPGADQGEPSVELDETNRPKVKGEKAAEPTEPAKEDNADQGEANAQPGAA